MRIRQQLFVILCFIVSFVAEWGTSAFLNPSPRQCTTVRSFAAEVTEERPNCYYRSPLSSLFTRQWTPRIELAELVVGQKLEGAVVVQEKLDGRTGPKVWVDCGVGRYKKSWKIQTAMLRLGGSNMKISVATKKAARLRKKKQFPVYVSRIRLDNDQMEVTLDEKQEPIFEPKTLVSVSRFKVGQELSGIIQRVEDYGILVDVGANRPGLLHIRQVGNLYQKYIDKSKGLKKVGLVKGVQVDVQVISIEKKRLFLDFSEALKQEAERKYSVQEEDANVDPYAEEAALYAAQQQAAVEDQDNDDNDDEEYDDDDEDDYYDEDRDIEDAMGLGTY